MTDNRRNHYRVLHVQADAPAVKKQREVMLL